MIEIRGLHKEFAKAERRVVALQDIDLTVAEREFVAILGPSGCGKSTLLNMVAGFDQPTRGSVQVAGEEIVAPAPSRGVVFQEPALFPWLTVRKNVEMAMRFRGVAAVERQSMALDLLRLVHLEGFAERRPHELSGGMRQRAMIAMALALRPAVVIGDEPTTALDVMVQAQILELLEHLRQELGLSLILITHDLSVIAETCDRVLIMYAGRVAEEGSVDEVFRRPRHPYTQKLLSAFPNIHADRRTLEVIPGAPPDLRHPPPGCRFAPRCEFAMAVCSEVVPPEVSFDGVRVACHLYPPGSDGVAVTTPTADAIGATVPLVEPPGDELPLETELAGHE